MLTLLLTYAAYALPKNLDGIDFTQPKRGTVILFVSAKCPCSAAHEKSMKKLHAEMSQDFAFYAIVSNQDESDELIKTHFQDFPFPLKQDKGAKIADTFHAFKTPHAYIVDKQGVILFQGGIDDSHCVEKVHKEHLKTALIQIQNGKKPDPDSVRVLGCQINR